MEFKDFVEMSSLMDLLDVPQRPDFHAEGPVKNHAKLVRQQVDNAIQVVQGVASQPESSFSQLDTSFSEEDRNILRLASWLHDLGKRSATTPDLRSIGHESPKHFNPAARELMQSPMWGKMLGSASLEDKKDLWFVISNHMSLKDQGFGRRLMRKFVDTNGKYYNTRRVKLLLTFILMDRIGRKGKHDPMETINAFEAGAKKFKQSQIRQKQSQPAPNNEFDFVQQMLPKLANKPMPMQIGILKGALQGKFRRSFSDQEIIFLMGK